jgi:hypothetical protein
MKTLHDSLGSTPAHTTGAIPGPVVIGTWVIVVLLSGLTALWARRWHRSPTVVWLTPLILALPVAVAAVASLWAVRQPWPRADRLALLTLITGVVALSLAGAAAIIAAAAFRQSTEEPDLELEIYFHDDPPDKAILLAGPTIRIEDPAGPDRGWVKLQELLPSEYSSLSVRIAIGNRGKVTATHVAVRIKLIGMGGLNQAQPPWKPLPSNFWRLHPFEAEFGCTAIQWEGGGDEVVHANWDRVLPPLSFGGVKVLHSSGGSETKLEVLERNAARPSIVAEAVTDSVKGLAARKEIRIELAESEHDQGDRLHRLMGDRAERVPGTPGGRAERVPGTRTQSESQLYRCMIPACTETLEASPHDTPMCPYHHHAMAPVEG